jgi:hypothetical protein
MGAYADAIRTAIGANERAVDLSQSEVLVLMTIAYFQPITRAELSAFFGREISRDLIGNLRSFGLIASGPRSPTPDAPYTYVTTKPFLLQFGFDTLRDLPDFEALEDAGLLSKEKLLAGDIPVGLGGHEEDGADTRLRIVEELEDEELFGMSSGWVLDFTNATFADFFQREVGVDIYSDADARAAAARESDFGVSHRRPAVRHRPCSHILVEISRDCTRCPRRSGERRQCACASQRNRRAAWRCIASFVRHRGRRACASSWPLGEQVRPRPRGA